MPVFRPARNEDIPAIAAILGHAVDRMFAEGKHQWTRQYPRDIHVQADIEAGTAYVLTDHRDDNHILAYGAIILTGEPAYDHLDGTWLTQSPDANNPATPVTYATIHRIAVNPDARRRGLAKLFITQAGHLAATHGKQSIRIDTNHDNTRMLNLLTTLTFTPCGHVTYPSGPRLAFELPL